MTTLRVDNVGLCADFSPQGDWAFDCAFSLARSMNLGLRVFGVADMAWDRAEPRALSSDETIALVNIGASVMNINVLHDGSSIFWRDVAFGGNQYTEAIQRELNLPREDAERLKLGDRVGEHSLQQVMGVLNSVSEDLAAELQKTFDFFVATSSVDRLDRVVLAGGSAQVLNLSEILKERFQVNVEVLNPFRNIRYTESDFDPEWINRHAPAMSVAVGLAVRMVGE